MITSPERKPSYAERLEKHMIRYKHNRLNVRESGTWKGRRGLVERAHILPYRQRDLNILPSIRSSFWVYWDNERRTRQPKPTLHRGFAHLTSSQAMAFNLFFPFLNGESDRSAPLLAALGVAPERIAKWGFEWTLHDDGTSVDCGMELDSGEVLLVEVKLREREFGRCKNDTDHQEKFADTYAEPLRQIVASDCLSLPDAFKNYQVLRNFWLLRQARTRVTFLFPRENEMLARGEAFIRSVPLEAYRSRVSVVHLETLVEELTENTALHPDLRAHMRMFREKYVALGDPFTSGDGDQS
jgi:hypothetical protein